jgi:integrase
MRPSAGGRSRPVLEATQRGYLARVLPACLVWAAAGKPLAAVTSDDLLAALEGLQGHRRSDVIVAFRSLFAALKADKRIFGDPARSLRHPPRPDSGAPALPTQALAELVAGADRAQDRVALLLIGVHAIPAHRLRHLTVDDVDLGRGTLQVNGRHRRLDRLTLAALRDWLLVRRQRWSNTANPHLFIAPTSHYGDDPVAPGYFKAILKAHKVGSRQLRRSRLQTEAEASLDPLRLARLYDVDATSALTYVRAAKAATGGPAT